MNNVRVKIAEKVSPTLKRPLADISKNFHRTHNKWNDDLNIKSLVTVTSTKPGGYDKANLTFLT